LAQEELCPVRQFIEICKKYDSALVYFIATREGLRIYGIDSTNIWVLDSFIPADKFILWDYDVESGEERIVLPACSSDLNTLNFHNGQFLHMSYVGGSVLNWGIYDYDEEFAEESVHPEDILGKKSLCRLKFESTLMESPIDVFAIPYDAYTTHIAISPLVGKIVKNFQKIDADAINISIESPVPPVPLTPPNPPVPPLVLVPVGKPIE
jgi:hypothetical protein